MLFALAMNAQETANKNHTLVYTSGTQNPNVCQGMAMTDIKYTAGDGADGAIITWSGNAAPEGISPAHNATVNGTIISISGTPTKAAVAGTYTYTITTKGDTNTPAKQTGTIVINPVHTLAHNASSGEQSQTVCQASAINAITFTAGGGATGTKIIWNMGSTPAGLSSSRNATISGTPTAAGVYTYTATTTGNNCAVATQTGIITVKPKPVLTAIDGTTPACDSLVLSTSVSNNVAATIYWQDTTNNGMSMEVTCDSQLVTIIGTSTYYFRARGTDGGCWSDQVLKKVTIDRKPSITTHPTTAHLSTTQNLTFSPASLSITASGTALTYQWRRATPDASGAQTPTSGELAPKTNKTASYTLPSKDMGHWRYFCVVGTTSACSSTTVVSELSGVCNVSSACDFTTTDRNPVSIFSASFATDKTWTVGSQVWSDAVISTDCDKTEFRGGSGSSPNVDCCSNPSYSGDLFSWCVVVKYANTLCPAPWRVPTKDDFIALDKALGGTGDNDQNNVALTNSYINTWGGTYSGYVRTGGLDRQGTNAFYWTQTEVSAALGYSLDMFANGYVNPQSNFSLNSKYRGYALRCVR